MKCPNCEIEIGRAEQDGVAGLQGDGVEGGTALGEGLEMTPEEAIG